MNSLYKYHHSHSTTCFDRFFSVFLSFSLQFMPWSFILFQFSMDFYSFFFWSDSNLNCILLSDFEKRVPKTCPRCNICHVLYPDNWRFSIVAAHFFFFSGMFTRFSVIVIVFPVVCGGGLVFRFHLFGFWNLLIYMKMI